MTTVAVRQRVADFDAWKVVYDEHGAVREQLGTTGDRVLRGANDPNEVLVLTHWPELANAQAFLADPSLKDAMSRAGVIDEPRIEVYEETDD